MSINDFSLPDLILYAQLEKNDNAVNVLLDRVNRLGNADGIQELRASAPQFEALFEAWDDQISASVDKAKFCVRIAELSLLDSAAFRSSLNYAVRKLLPPYLVSGAVVKALGAKDAGVGVREVALRLKKLQRLRSTAIMYQAETGLCGRITGIDRVTGTIAVTPIDGSSSSSIPIASAVVSAYFFETTPELMDLISPLASSVRPSSEYRRILNRLALVEVPEQKIQEFVQRLLVPQVFTAATFASWWDAAPAAASTGGKRHFSDSRSVLELYTLLKGVVDAGGAVTVDETAAGKLGKLFVRVSSRLLPKDVQMLAESISWLSLGAAPELLASMFTPLRGQVPFWPASIPADVKLANLAIWAKVSVKDLDGLLAATRAIYTQDEFVSLGLMLPLRCMTVFFEPRKKAAVESKEETAAREAEDAALVQSIITKIAAMDTLSADVCLWIWKNKARIKSKIITSLVDMETVVAALNRSDLPKEWGAAQRELKRILLGEKADFRKYLIENADGDIPSIVGSLQKFRTQASELQSVMVKMGRISPEFMEYIESGEGSKLLGIHAAGSTTEQPPVASLASQKRMQAELKHLVEVLIPQNAEAVAYARSFGDLRENAEYDAAKEQRRFLQRRRSELEKSLGFMDVTDFSDVKLTDVVVPGCRVFLKDAAGKEVSYYILGAWDGDVDRGRIAYKAPLGQALVEHKVGEKVKLPELGECVIAKVEPLPADMIKELSGE